MAFFVNSVVTAKNLCMVKISYGYKSVQSPIIAKAKLALHAHHHCFDFGPCMFLPPPNTLRVSATVLRSNRHDDSTTRIPQSRCHLLLVIEYLRMINLNTSRPHLHSYISEADM